MDISTARDFQSRIESAARELNSNIVKAAKVGLVIEINTIDVRQLCSPEPVPFVEVSVKIRPSDITIGDTASAS